MFYEKAKEFGAAARIEEDHGSLKSAEAYNKIDDLLFSDF